jgi:outer membrane protein TolC
MRPSYIALCLIALAAAVVSSCCGRTEEPKAQAAAGPSPASVVVQNDDHPGRPIKIRFAVADTDPMRWRSPTWWQQFGHLQLDALVPEALSSNREGWLHDVERLGRCS